MTLTLRLATVDDGPAFAAIYRPAVEERATSFELVAPDGEELGRRIAKVLARTPWIVAERGGDVLGYAYAGPFRERPAYRWSVETSAYVRPDAQRLGLARALYTSLFALLTQQGFRTAFAGITLPNDASVGFHESLGFTRVGTFHAAGHKFGRWHDIMFLERPLAPRVADAPEPVALPALASRQDIAPLLAAGLATRRVG